MLGKKTNLFSGGNRPCIFCNIIKPDQEMHSLRKCKPCEKIRLSNYIDRLRARSTLGHSPEIPRTCIRCKETKPPSDMFSRRKCFPCEATRKTPASSKYQIRHKERCRLARAEIYKQKKEILNKRNRDVRRKYPEKTLWIAARKRAVLYYLEFDILVSDIAIPKKCPILGINLEIADGRKKPNSPSLDRIDNSKGYIKGNVAVISYRANQIKNDANLQEIEKLYLYMKRQFEPKLT